MNILLLEDEYALRSSIKEYLTDKGYHVDDFGDGEKALDAVYSRHYDLLLLDIKVPKKSGRDVALQLRQDGYRTPIIFTTSLTHIDDIEKGYEAGCCDYIKKPFELRELLLRITQVMKNSVFKSEETLISLPLGYGFDLTSMKLSKNGDEISLTKKESLMIALLVEHLGQSVSSEKFCDYVWGEYVDPANVRVHINNLRKKLDGDLIINLRGIGYKIDKI